MIILKSSHQKEIERWQAGNHILKIQANSIFRQKNRQIVYQAIVIIVLSSILLIATYRLYKTGNLKLTKP